MDGSDFISGIWKTLRGEIEKTKTLCARNLALLLNCLGIRGIDLLAMVRDDEELDKEELETVLTFLDHQISILNAQKQFLATAIESESSATLQSLKLSCCLKNASSFGIGTKSARPLKTVVDVSIRAVRTFSSSDLTEMPNSESEATALPKFVRRSCSRDPAYTQGVLSDYSLRRQ